MNHRELILSARKKARFAFLGLPEDLQDEIVDGLDGQTLTLQDASALVKARGSSLSHEGIAGYYRALRFERRVLESKQELARVIAEYASKPQAEALDGLLNLALGIAASGLADGTVGIKDINIAKLVESAAKSRASKEKDSVPDSKHDSRQPKGQLSAETLEKIRRDVYGF